MVHMHIFEEGGRAFFSFLSCMKHLKVLHL